MWIANVLIEILDEPEAKNILRRISRKNIEILDSRKPNQGKDALWEADLYRRLKKSNATITFNEPDLIVTLPNGLSYAIACKKKYYLNEKGEKTRGIKSALDKGVRQLNKNMYGLIAINIDDLLPENFILNIKKIKMMTNIYIL